MDMDIENLDQVEDLQLQVAEVKDNQVISLSRTAIALNYVIQEGIGDISPHGLNVLRKERDRITTEVYGLVKGDENGMFLVSALLAQAEMGFVAEVSDSNETVYYHSMQDLDRYSQFD